MATPALIVVISVGVLTLVVLGASVLFLLQQLKLLTGSLRGVSETLQPRLDALAADAAVAQRELARLSETAAGTGRAPEPGDDD